MNDEKLTADEKAEEKKKKEKELKEKAEKIRKQREADNFKRKYFDHYDDVKISYKEDW